MKVSEFKDHLTQNLIPFWNRLKDDEHGGFYSYVDGAGTPDKQYDKGVILHSRILWFYSSAYQLLQDEQLLHMADHAYQFLVDFCIDSQYGGVYWSVHYDGSVADDTKHTYNQAFAIYALSAYYRASGRKEALNHAYELYRLIEERCSDEDGYLEAFHRDFSIADNDKLSENGVMAYRTMNTLLHILEAYTELYLADHFYKVGDSIRNILIRFKSKIYNPDKKIFNVFFDEYYNSLIDLESFGHDIEASWLIDRACQAINDAGYQKEMQKIIKGLAESACKNGMDWSLSAINNECEKNIVDTKKVWWVQAEAVTGFFNIYQKYPDGEKYLKNAEDVWRFIQEYVIDKNTGEWIENIEDVTSIDTDQALVHHWKCPYHNGRMCIEMIKRLSALCIRGGESNAETGK